MRALLARLLLCVLVVSDSKGLVSTIESRTSGDGADNFDVVSCNKNCTSGQNECPEGCFCGLLGQNKKGHCYKIIGNLSGEPPVVRR
uniref:Evasin-3 n=1 Tax=Rhipicephalus sanguineus TaxID=34632 RepID=EVA3_RHISA|nr:RecName: Full=Evasin-3; Short=EVA3; Flags: Precursor [Rhipicephalus sanguineus]